MLVFLLVPALAADRGIADVDVPGSPRFVEIARDVFDVRLALNPEVAVNAGLYADAARVPSYAPGAVSSLAKRLRRDQKRLGRLPWDDLSVDEQIDVRWTWALADEALHRLTVERSWTHRPAEWLEPVSNSWIALVGQVPDRVDLQQALAAKLPAVLDEVRVHVTAPTARDVETTREILDGLVVLGEGLPEGGERARALASLAACRASLPDPAGLPEYTVIGSDAYAWRLEHAMLSPWTPDELLAAAQQELDAVDARLVALGADGDLPPPSDPTPDEIAAAEALDREGLLGLYDRVVEENLAELRTLDVITLPADLPPLRARETPDAMVPLTGDGGSMNPVTLFGEAGSAWWNVEHFDPAWTREERLEKVMNAWRHPVSRMGPYAVHEGVPGHHLQLALARANPTRSGRCSRTTPRSRAGGSMPRSCSGAAARSAGRRRPRRGCSGRIGSGSGGSSTT